MKIPALAIAVGLLTQPAVVQAQEVSANKACGLFAHLAETMARRHQEGMSLQEALDLIGERAPNSVSLVQPMALMIWAKPRYNTAEHQARAVLETRDDVHVACLQTYNQ